MNTFKAGAAKINITPPVGIALAGYGAREKCSDEIDDDLYSKALVLADGSSEVAVITNDLIGVPVSLVERVRGFVGEQTGVPSENVLICASHTHYGPVVEPVHYMREAIGEKVDEEWLDVLARKMAGAVFMAHKSLQEAKIGVAKGSVQGIAYNRDTKRADGKAEMSFRYPGAETNLKFGPTDPGVSVLRVDDADGHMFAALINFACHPVCDSDNLYAISAEYPARSMQLIEALEGGICLFALGAAGNINPVHRGLAGRKRTGLALGGEALKLLQLAEPCGGGRVWASRSQVELPLKPTAPAEEVRKQAEEAKALLAELERREASADEIGAARSKFLRLTRALARAERHGTESMLSSEVQLVGIGEVVLVGLPGEVFVEIGLEIKRRSPFANTFVISLANDELDYVPTTEAYEAGGYESEWTKVGPGTDRVIIEAALALMERYRNSIV